MRLLSSVIILAGLLGLMAYTNPTLTEYNNFIRQQIVQETQKHKEDTFAKAFGNLLSGVGSSLVTSQTVRTDYLFFSVYEARLGKERVKALGVFNNFLLIEKPHLK